MGFNHIVPRVGRHVRPVRRRQDGAQGQLRALRLQPGHEPGRRGQPQHRRPVQRGTVEDAQQRPGLPARRADNAGTAVGGVRQRLHRRGPRERLRAGVLDLRRARGYARTWPSSAGYVWKKDSNGYQQVNVLRPFDAYNVPVQVARPWGTRNVHQALNLMTPRAGAATSRRTSTATRAPTRRSSSRWPSGIPTGGR